MGRRSRGFCGARRQLCLGALAGRCSYIRSPVRQRFDRAPRAGKYSGYRILVTLVPLQSPVTPPVPSSWRPSSEGRVRCCRCPADDWWPPHVGDTPRPCRWNPTKVMNWEASARDAEGKHCSTGISSPNRPAMSPSSALATLEFERSSIFVNFIPLARLKLLSPGLSLPDLLRSVRVAVTNAARPWRARWSAVIFVIADLPGRRRRGDLAQQGSYQPRQPLPLFRNRRRLMLVHVEQVWPSTRGLLLHAWLPPRSLNRVALGRRTCARRQKSPKRVDMVKGGRAANA